MREADFLRYIEKSDTEVTRRTLNLWRSEGYLEENLHWYTDGTFIVYSVPKTLNAILARKNESSNSENNNSKNS